MLGQKKGSKKNGKAKKKKDTLDEEDELFQNTSMQQPSMSDGAPGQLKKKSSWKFFSKETTKPKKEASVMNNNNANAKRNSASRKSKKVVKVDPALCAAVKKFEEQVRNMLSSGGLTRYFETHLQSYQPQGVTTTSSDANPAKNRANHSCYDHTRVKLEMDGTRKSDYINASLVKFNDVHRKYIMTQYPLPEALEDFWSMVFGNEVETILSVFNPHGDRDIKEYQDRPGSKKRNSSDKRQSSQMNTCKLPAESSSNSKALSMRETSFNMSKSQYEIASKSKRCALADSTSYFPLNEGQYVTIGKYFIHTRKIEQPEKPDRPYIYTIEVLPEGCSECRFVRVVNYPTWSAKGTPYIKIILHLIRSISLDPLQKGPVVVHCDDGANRSATLVLTDVVSNRLLEGKTVDIEEMFRQIRNQRCGSFQTAFYFTFAVYSVSSYIFLRCKSRGGNAETIGMMKQLVKDLGKQFGGGKEDPTS